MNRCFDAGWKPIHVPDERRGLWMRHFKANDYTHVEFCAGREGDDNYVKLSVGQKIDSETIAALVGVMETYEYALEMAKLYPNPDFILTEDDWAEELGVCWIETEATKID